jgi:hypothetical protein
MSLLNVKLKPDDVRMAQALRKEGITISDVVRDAIRAEYQRRIGRRTSPRRPSDRMAEIYASHPDPPDLPQRSHDVHDPHAARRAIGARLRRSAR